MTAAALRALTANHGASAISDVQFVEEDGTELVFVECRVIGAKADESGLLTLSPGTVPTLVIVLRR